MDDIDKQIQTLQEELDKLKELKNRPSYGKVVLSDATNSSSHRAFRIKDRWAGSILHNLDRKDDGADQFPNAIPPALFLADCQGKWRTAAGTVISGYLQFTPK